MWRASFQAELDRGQEAGLVAEGVDIEVAAHTLVAQIEGVLSLVRNSQDPEDLVVGARGYELISTRSVRLGRDSAPMRRLPGSRLQARDQ